MTDQNPWFCGSIHRLFLHLFQKKKRKYFDTHPGLSTNQPSSDLSEKQPSLHLAAIKGENNNCNGWFSVVHLRQFLARFPCWAHLLIHTQLGLSLLLCPLKIPFPPPIGAWYWHVILNSKNKNRVYSDGTRHQTSDIFRLTSPNVRLILVGQDIMSGSHLSKKDTDMH